MYSPKIEAELIPTLYRLAKARGIPMTRLVNACLRSMLDTPAVRRELAVVQTGGTARDEGQEAPTARIAATRHVRAATG